MLYMKYIKHDELCECRVYLLSVKQNIELVYSSEMRFFRCNRPIQKGQIIKKIQFRVRMNKK